MTTQKFGGIKKKPNMPKISFVKNRFEILVFDKENQTKIICNNLINAAGIFASNVANSIEGLDKKYIPKI